jgi:hypothetical protein
MSPRRWLVLSCLVLSSAGAVRSAAAQSSARVAWQATPASMLKSALRSAVAAQQRFRAANGTYAPAIEQLGIPREPGVRVEIVRAGPDGWQAKAMHQQQPGRSCVVFVGSLEGAEAPRTDRDREMAGEEGIPLCDLMR